MKKITKYVIELLPYTFAIAMLLLWTGCGEKREDVPADIGTTLAEQQEEGPKLVYTMSEITLEVEPWSYGFIKQIGDYLYYFTVEEEGFCFYRYFILDGTTEQVTKLIPGGNFPNRFDIGEDGSIYGVRDNTEMQLLMKYDAEGNEIYQVDLQKELHLSYDETEGVKNLLCDREGRVCLICYKKIFLFDKEGGYLGSPDSFNGSEDATIYYNGKGADGKIYVRYLDNTAPAGKNDFLLGIDMETRTFQPVDGEFCHHAPICAGIKRNFLYNRILDDTLYDYDPETQTMDPLFCWNDYPIEHSDLYDDIYSLGATSQEQIVVVMIDWKNDKKQILLFSKELSNKEELVLGAVSPSTSLLDAVVLFNKESDDYHVTVKDYLEGRENNPENREDAWTRLNMELVSGNGPDLLDLSSTSGVQKQALAEQRFLEDLGPYLDKSSVIHREDFVGRVLEAVTFDGQLIALPRQFQLYTVVGRTSDVGTGAGWTMEEFMELVEARPGARIMESYDKETLLRFCTGYDLDAFVDHETGKCHFDSPEFVRLLEFVDRYGIRAGSGDESYAEYIENIRNGNILLYVTSLMKLMEIQRYDDMFGGAANVVGYPTGDGSAGHYIQVYGTIGIAANSGHKEGAWVFLESLIPSKIEQMGYDLPALKSCLEEQMREEMEVVYKLDEEGEPVLDENGEKIPDVKDYIAFADGWRFDYHALTEEEAARVMEIVNTARPQPVEDEKIHEIIYDETKALFDGSKTAAQVADVIQNRVQLYLYER